MAEDMSLGTRVVEAFGGWVTDQLDERPNVASWALTRAFEVKRAQTRHLPERQQLPSGRMGARIALEGVTGALEHPDEAVLTSVFLPCEPFLAMGLRPLMAEALADFITGARAEEGFVRAAEQRGVPETYCSFHKILLGAAAARVLAPPRLIANCSVACDANNTTFRWLAGELGSPHVYIDVPFAYSEDACVYVADQLREMGRAAEDVFGRRLDEAALAEHVARTQETLAAMRRTLSARRGRYLHNDMGLEMQQALALYLSLGTADTLGMARQMLADYPRAAEFRGLSLVWVHSAPYFSPALQGMIDQSRTAQIVASDMCFSQVEFEPWAHGPEEPWEAMAERLIKNSFNGPGARRIERVRRLAEEAGADGVVVFCHWGCKGTEGIAQMARAELEAGGFPTLVLDGDCCHRANNAEGQAATRMGAFLEMLQARRAGGAASDSAASGSGEARA